jgi:hypothetical protein
MELCTFIFGTSLSKKKPDRIAESHFVENMEGISTNIQDQRDIQH